jgi:hypothetical protein
VLKIKVIFKGATSSIVVFSTISDHGLLSTSLLLFFLFFFLPFRVLLMSNLFKLTLKFLRSSLLKGIGLLTSIIKVLEVS